KIEVRFCAACDDGKADRKTVTALGLNVAQDGFAFESVEGFSHREHDAVLRKIISQPRAGLRVDVAIQQISVAMHEPDLHFHHAQACRRLARQQTASEDRKSTR